MQKTGQASRASSSFWNAEHSPLPATRGHPFESTPYCRVYYLGDAGFTTSALRQK